MQYIRFWIRTCIVFCPVLFFLLFFGVHIALWKALLSTIITCASGIILVAPLAWIAGRVDRSMWSEQAYILRMERKRDRLAKLQVQNASDDED